MKPLRKFLAGFRWEDVTPRLYKDDGASFRDVTRQVLFDGDGAPGCQVRYFEVGPGGFTTLERHEHTHAVMVLRGRGRALVGDEVQDLEPFDLLTVPPRTWHQLRAGTEEPLGFLCVVDCERDRPEPATPSDVATLSANPRVRTFLSS